jgi:hypothetical protein
LFKRVAKATEAIEQSVVIKVGIVSFILKTGIQGEFGFGG